MPANRVQMPGAKRDQVSSKPAIQPVATLPAATLSPTAMHSPSRSMVVSQTRPWWERAITDSWSISRTRSSKTAPPSWRVFRLLLYCSTTSGSRAVIPAAHSVGQRLVTTRQPALVPAAVQRHAQARARVEALEVRPGAHPSAPHRVRPGGRPFHPAEPQSVRNRARPLECSSERPGYFRFAPRGTCRLHGIQHCRTGNLVSGQVEAPLEQGLSLIHISE